MTTLTPAAIQQAATLLLAARRDLQPLADWPADCRPRTAADAYAIQNAVALALWGAGSVKAWKVGAPDAVSEPSAAPIGSPLLYVDGVTLTAGDFHRPGVEGELAFSFSRDLPPVAGGYDQDTVTAAINAVYPALELVATRLADWDNADPLCKLADNASNGALIVGPALVDWRGIDPRTQPARLQIDGQTVADTVGGNAAQDLLRLLVWLVNHCAEHGGGLKAGDIVTTGTFTGLIPVSAGAAVSVEFPGVGSARLQLA